jgi:putative ubiquitin-RnfH superfamily antitoxin RatB of RatAB toxin-antitoxin module
MIKIEVAFATAQQQKIIKLEVSESCTLRAAILQSQIASLFPEYDLSDLPLGVFGKRIFEPEQYSLKDGDRIEIYRPLTTSPNQKRLDRAKGK